MNHTPTMRELNECFIENARRSAVTPVRAIDRQPVIAASDRWVPSADKTTISKKFSFISTEKRNQFVFGMLAREEHYKHPTMKTVIDDNEVCVTLGTRDLQTVTELDRELASFCDVLHKELLYSHLDASRR